MPSPKSALLPVALNPRHSPLVSFGQTYWSLIALLFSMLGFGCASTTVTPEVQLEERREFSRGSLAPAPFSSANELALLAEVSEKFHSTVTLKPLPGIRKFLNKLGTDLFRASQSQTPVHLDEKGVDIAVIDKIRGKWRNVAVPASQFYLSLGLLMRLEYENELAAAIAIQIGHLRLGHLARRIESEIKKSEELGEFLPPGIGPDLFGPRGVFYFSDEMEKAAIGEAVGILYRCGYDPRGIVLMLEKYLGSLSESPFAASTLSHLIEEARRQVAHLAPLRNPTLRSDEFLVMMRKLRTK